MSMKICMIGCGSFARLCHGPAQREYRARHPDAELAACADGELARARDYAAAFGFTRACGDSGEMLAAERPDAVVMAVPPSATCAAALPLLERGIPLLLEKPPGMTPGELGRMIAAAARGGGRAQVGFNRRYMPIMRRACDILEREFPPNSLSRIEYVMKRIERWDPDFSTTAVHALDAAIFLARSPLVSARLRFEVHAGDGRETASAFLEAWAASGAEVRVTILPLSTENAETAVIHGMDQRLVLGVPFTPQSPGDGSVEHWVKGARVLAFTDRDAGPDGRMGVIAETEAFLEGVRSGGILSPGLADCRQAVALMEAVRLRRAGPVNFGSH